MTPEQIAEIRVFADELWLGHSQCEDSWYSCPLSEEGTASDETECNCDQPEWEAAKEHVDALLAEVERLRKWAEFTNAFAERTMPHAMGQGHLALMSISSQMKKALNGDEVFVQ